MTPRTKEWDDTVAQLTADTNAQAEAHPLLMAIEGNVSEAAEVLKSFLEQTAHVNGYTDEMAARLQSVADECQEIADAIRGRLEALEQS